MLDCKFTFELWFMMLPMPVSLFQFELLFTAEPDSDGVAEVA